MLLIKTTPETNGVHASQASSAPTLPPDGWAIVPPRLELEAYSYLPFIDLTVENGEVVAVAQGEIPPPDITPIRTETLSTLSAAGRVAIVAGVTVALPSTGEAEHFALEETDQINLTAALTAVEQGATGYPYHADGQLCRLYSAEDIMAISQAAVAHKLYHTTYCNHLLMWARRSETAEELSAITYGADLPVDLAANMEAMLGNA